jgi:hypothetical protein
MGKLQDARNSLQATQAEKSRTEERCEKFRNEVE